MSPITEEDNGTWMCKVYGADETGTVEGFAEIEVVVAVPPQTVNLRYVFLTQSLSQGRKVSQNENNLCYSVSCLRSYTLAFFNISIMRHFGSTS